MTVSFSFQKIAKLTILGFFKELLSTQNVQVARFARNVEWDFFCYFQSGGGFGFVRTIPDKVEERE